MLLVGLAIYVALTLFSANAEEASRNAVIHDLQNFSANATAFYAKVVAQGGGGGSYKDITLGQILPMAENLNGSYFIESATDNDCVIVGVGKVVASDGDSVRVRVRVTPQRNVLEIIH